MRRLLPLAVIATILIGLALVLFSEAPGPRPRHDGGPPSPEKPVPIQSAPTAKLAEQAGTRTNIEPTLEAEELLSLSDGVGKEDGWPSFTGRVLSPDGTPAANTQIQAWAQYGWASSINPNDLEKPPVISWETTTTNAGQFAFPEAPQDGLRFVIRITHPDWPRLELLNLPAHPGRTRPLGDIQLTEGFSISGNVTDSNARALGMIKIRPTAESETYSWGESPSNPIFIEGYETTTDVKGNFTMSNLPSTRLRLVAEGENFVRTFSSAVSGKPKSTQSGLHIEMEPSARLHGILLSLDQLPLSGAKVQASTSELDLECLTDEHGAWSFDISFEASSANIRYAAAGFWPARQKLKADALTENIVYQLKPMLPTTGVVVDAQGAPIAGARVALLRGNNSRTGDLDPDMIEANTETISAKDGTFALQPDLTRTWSRRFRVAAWDDIHSPVFSKTINYGYQSGGDNPVIPELRLVLTDGWRASGVVLDIDGTPRPNARVHLRRLKNNVPASRRRPMVSIGVRPGKILRRMTTDQSGAFSFEGIREGDYRLEAHYPDRSPAESEDFALLGNDFETALRLNPTAAIDGTLNGDLSPFSVLRAQASALGRDSLDTTVDPTGHFVFENLAPDTWKVEIREADGSNTSRTVFTMGGGGEPLAKAEEILVEAGARVPVVMEFDFEGRGSISGLVTVNGKPAADMNLLLLPRGLGSDSSPQIAQRQIWNNLISTQTDFEGRYQYFGLPEDNYWVVVNSDANSAFSVFNSDTASESGPGGLARAEINLSANQNLNFDFQIFTGSLRIFASKPNGKPWTGWGEINPTDPHLGLAKQWISIRRKGEGLIENIPAGNWDLKLQGGDLWKISHTPFSISGGSITAIEVIMERAPRKDKTKETQDDNGNFIFDLGHE